MPTALESIEGGPYPLAQPAVAESGQEHVLERVSRMACPKHARLTAIEHDAAVEQDDLGADGAGEVQILGCDEDSAAASGEGGERLAEHHDRLGVERRSRL